MQGERVTEMEDHARELLSRPIVGQLGYMGMDGYPKVNPTWFLFTDGEIQVASPPNAFKSRSLRLNPRAVLTVSTLEYPHKIASASGTVSVEVLQEKRRVEFVERVASRYLTPEQTRDYIAGWIKGGSPGDGDLLRLRIERMRFTDTGS
jgi:nitroimidazol reductase NimA-like FMN-containing flavoprotein (pyridoxamine 5'-phosphate oxidase superfamily)